MRADRTVRCLVSAIVCAAAVFIAQAAIPAEKWPNKALRFIVPYAPGGGADIMARTLQAKLVDIVGQQVVIDNRPGAGGQTRAVSAR